MWYIYADGGAPLASISTTRRGWAMRRVNPLLVLGMIFIALFGFGCSNDTAVAPSASETDLEAMDGADAASAAKVTTTTTVTIWGTVCYLDGTPAPGVSVRIDRYFCDFFGCWWADPVFVKTNYPDGVFSYIVSVMPKNTLVRCSSLGDTESQIYNGVSAYMYFNLKQVPLEHPGPVPAQDPGPIDIPQP